MTLARRDVLALGTGALALGFGARPARAADKTIVLGASLPLSGPAAPLGITQQRTIEHAFEVINAQGIQVGDDRYTVTPKFYDNKYVPAEAVAIVEKMLADGVRYLYSSGSGNSVPVVGKTTEAKVLQMSAASGKGHLTGPQFPYSFRVQPTNETAFAVYPWIKTAYPDVKRVAHMNPSDEAGYTESEDRRMIAEKNGFTNVGNEYFKRGSTDMYPVATRLAGLNPDMIDFGGTIGRDQGLAAKALRELGYKGKILLGYSDAKSFVEIAGPDAAEGTILFDTLAEAQTPRQKELADWWVAKYGPPFPTYAFLIWDWPFIFAEAIRKAQSVDPVKVAGSMRTTTYNGIFGEEKFGMKSVYGVDCSLTRQIPMSVIKNGKPSYVATVDWPAEFSPLSTTLLLQIVLSGLVTGLIYMLIALGVTLLFGILRVVNFVHGELAMLSAFAVWFVGVDQGWPMPLAIIVAVVVAALVGIGCQKFLFKPLQYDILNCFIVGIGASFAIRSASWAIFGPEPQAIPAMLPGVINMGGVFMAKQRLLAAGVCVVLAVALYLFLHYTKPGTAMRAVEQDREAAMLMGINPESVYVSAFVISAALAAVGGAMLGSVFGVDPEMGAEPLLKAFIIVQIGGMGSIAGTVLAGLFIGIADSVTGTLLGGELAFIIDFAILMLILIVRPRGLFGYDV